MSLAVTHDTTEAWPPRMRTGQAARYLTEVHGLPSQEKTLRNWRSTGRGPTCQYYGTLPLYDRPELDRWAENDALKPESPTGRTRRLARQGARQAFPCYDAPGEAVTSDLMHEQDLRRAQPSSDPERQCPGPASS
jgi:hypothetical protein